MEKIYTDKGTAQWLHIKQCYDLLKDRNFSFIPRITELHMNP